MPEYVLMMPFFCFVLFLFSASLPGMWERTVTIGSAGKTFSVTGWKLGWAYGPSHIMKNLFTAHQNSLYACSTPVQVIAYVFATFYSEFLHGSISI